MAKQSKIKVCKNCNNPLPEKATVCPSCGAKNKKPFYKRIWFIVLAVIVVIAAVASIGGGGSKGEKFVWNDLELSAMLPKPKSNVGEIISNSEDHLSIYIHKISVDDYKVYLDECESLGFTVESDQSEHSYTAFNEAGYELNLWYNDSDEELQVSLDAPMEMGALEWPTSEIANLLPIPKSTVGSISRESSDGVFIYVGETSKDDYAAYVDECSANGFSVDYDKGDTYYYADNTDGYHLSLHYQGNSIMTIEIEAPDDSSETNAPSATENEDTQPTSDPSTSTEETSELVDGMRPEFKEAMDSYEAFFDEYVAFMKKYAASDGSDLTLLTDYADYMSKYADMMADFEAWDSEDMNTAETAYYIEVQSRISQKLLEVAE